MFSFFCFAFLFFRCLNWCVHSFLLSLLSNILVLIPPLQRVILFYLKHGVLERTQLVFLFYSLCSLPLSKSPQCVCTFVSVSHSVKRRPHMLVLQCQSFHRFLTFGFSAPFRPVSVTITRILFNIT